MIMAGAAYMTVAAEGGGEEDGVVEEGEEVEGEDDGDGEEGEVPVASGL